MALIKCPDCGREISDKAASCIHCGCPINPKQETSVTKPQPKMDNENFDSRKFVPITGNSLGTSAPNKHKSSIKNLLNQMQKSF